MVKNYYAARIFTLGAAAALGAASIVLAVGLIVQAVGGEPKHGVIIGKTFHPKHRYIVLMPVPGAKSLDLPDPDPLVRAPIPKSVASVPVGITEPQQYSVTLHAKDKDGMDAIYELYVSKQQFDSLRDGDSFSCGGKHEQGCKTEPDKYRDDWPGEQIEP